MIGDRIEAIDDVRVSHMSLQEAMHRIRHNRLDFVRLRLVPLAINILPNQDLGSYDTRTAKHMTGSKNSGIMDASEERNAFISCLTVSEQPASVDIIQNKTINIEEAQKMKRNKESSVEDNFDMIAMKGDDEKENIEYEEHAKGIENREEEIGYANRFDQVEHVLKKQWQEIRAQEDIDIG
ncbi:unnamed protein product [Protopolystoma xenopodis]|uniref:PDZ domain-containing protein n=1 Tax=Protopolystoma xenopodis TaxID=117903 RepID=A0A448WCY9_9PLAT|nr:unnamed protein product [Protopolystoma xenopodis]